MVLDRNNFGDVIGEISGFVFSYFMFTTILFYVFKFFDKFHGITYLQLMAATLLIALIGMMLTRFLR